MEHYYETFFTYVSKILTLPEEDKERIRNHFEAIKLKKGAFLFKEGKIPECHNFIVSGFVRNFHLDNEQNEITTDLNNGPRFFTSYFHFINQTISNENLQCITDCEVLRITLPNAIKTGNESPTQKEYAIKLFENLLEEEKQRNWKMINFTAEERYHDFARNNANILLHVPLKYIASYLGITQRHLSRLRK